MFGLLAGLIGIVVRLVFYAIFYGTPLVGFWLASSLAAYLGGPPWMPWVAGALLFPTIPGLWELEAFVHRRAGSVAWFTPVDRIGMRTFVVGLVFLGLLLCLYPQKAFVSLSTRGDWMLDGVKDPRVPAARRLLFAAAGGLEWLYKATKSNPYTAHIDEKALQRSKEAAEQREKELAKQKEQQQAETDGKGVAQPGDQVADKHAGTEVSQHTDGDAVNRTGDETAKQTKEEVSRTTEQADGRKLAQEVGQKQEQEVESEREQKPDFDEKHQQVDDKNRDQETAKQQKVKAARKYKEAIASVIKRTVHWPWKRAKLHPAIVAMPSSAETSIASVAQYIAKKETDPVQRIKALHDYVADRVAYDSDAFYSGHFPDQDAQTVFEKRKSVCAGYANLLAALAAAINEEIIVVVGDARDPAAGDKLTGIGHAWNAAKIDGRWYLIDACWDAGYVSREKGFTKRYKTDYLLPPPEVMVEDHFPEESTWQLLSRPLSQGEFLRQPMLRPGFQAADLMLISPRRAANETGAKAVIVVKNPSNQWLMAGLEQNGKRLGYGTEPTNSEVAQIECPLPGKGTYRVNMFVNPQSRNGQYDFVGSLDFVNR